MKQNEHNDWIEAMRQSLRDAEMTPPADGWMRLQQELGAPAPDRTPVSGPRAASRRTWRIVWPKVAAVAAAVLVGIVAGGLLLRPDRQWVQEGDVIASAADNASTSAPTPPQSEPKPLPQMLAEKVGLSEEPSDTPSSSIRRQTLLAAATSAERPASGSLSALSETPQNSAAERVDGPSPEETAVAATGRSALGSAPMMTKSAAADPVQERANPTRETAVAALETAAYDDRADAATRRAMARNTPSAAGVGVQGQPSAEPFVSGPAPRRRTSFSVHAGGSLSGGATSNPYLPTLQMSASNSVSESVGTGDKMAFVQRYDADDNTYRHHQPLSFGFSVSKEFRHGLSLESGVVYTLVRSDVQTRYSSEDVGQKLHFIGIPLRLNWRFLERGRFSLYIGAGGMAEKCVSARFGSTSVNEPAVQWSALAAVGAQYRLGNVVGLYFEPEGSYYFTETRLRTVRTESPLTLSLRLGVRLSF